MNQLQEIFGKIKDPYLGEDYLSLGAVKIISQNELEISLPYPITSVKDELTENIRRQLADNGMDKINLTFKHNIAELNPRPRSQQAAASQVAKVKNIIAVASGKGGVGKSTMSFYLARALRDIGASVGILDADIYGPSQPHLLKAEVDRKQLAGKEKDTLNPVTVDGLKTMSLRYLLDNYQTPTIWRGAMASNALQQMVFTTAWGELDYLVVDMPPGTGDIQLTLCQRVSLSAAVIVTTPHQLAVIGAEKGIEMFKKVYVPVVGMIENMSYYSCPQCGGNKHYIFGKINKKNIEAMGIETLAEIPISQDYNQSLLGETNELWRDLAFRLCIKLCSLGINRAPEIKVVND